MQIIHGAHAVVMKHQYAKAWPHSDIISCSHRSLHAFTSKFDSTLLGYAFFTLQVILHEYIYTYIHTVATQYEICMHACIYRTQPGNIHSYSYIM